MECDCAFWEPFLKGTGFGVMLIMTPSMAVLAVLLRRSLTHD